MSIIFRVGVSDVEATIKKALRRIGVSVDHDSRLMDRLRLGRHLCACGGDKSETDKENERKSLIDWHRVGSGWMRQTLASRQATLRSARCEPGASQYTDQRPLRETPTGGALPRVR